MSVARIAETMADVKERLDTVKGKCTELQKEYDELRKVTLPDAMEAAGMESVRIAGLGTISLRTDAYVSIKRGKVEEAYRWLNDTGFGDVVKEYVQPSTLKALVKEQFKEGTEIPDELFDCSPYTYATITKRK